jgi:uncharacterized Zn finger protein (UPF0148 family)
MEREIIECEECGTWTFKQIADKNGKVLCFGCYDALNKGVEKTPKNEKPEKDVEDWEAWYNNNTRYRE